MHYHCGFRFKRDFLYADRARPSLQLTLSATAQKDPAWRWKWIQARAVCYRLLQRLRTPRCSTLPESRIDNYSSLHFVHRGATIFERAIKGNFFSLRRAYTWCNNVSTRHSIHRGIRARDIELRLLGSSVEYSAIYIIMGFRRWGIYRIWSFARRERENRSVWTNLTPARRRKGLKVEEPAGICEGSGARKGKGRERNASLKIRRCR